MQSDRFIGWLAAKLGRLTALIVKWRSYHMTYHDMLTDPDELRELKNFWPVVTLEDGRVIRHSDIVNRKFPA